MCGIVGIREPDDFDEWGRQTEATLAAIVGRARDPGTLDNFCCGTSCRTPAHAST